MTKRGRTSDAGGGTAAFQITRRPAPVVFSARFRDAVRRVTERGRSQRNARGRGRVDIDSPWGDARRNGQVISRRQAQGRPRQRGASCFRQYGAGKDLAEGRHLFEADARAGLLSFPDRLPAGIFQSANQRGGSEVRTGRFSAATPCAIGSNPRARETRRSTAASTR
jgi:hypothetical protein